jgi:hypothetical protein
MSEIWFEIRVGENLDDRWSVWFQGMQILPWFENGNRIGTILFGCLPDQAAIFGVLGQIRNLNLTVISFRRISEPIRPTCRNVTRQLRFQIWI